MGQSILKYNYHSQLNSLFTRNNNIMVVQRAVRFDVADIIVEELAIKPRLTNK